jgi:hypothetical protein
MKYLGNEGNNLLVQIDVRSKGKIFKSQVIGINVENNFLEVAASLLNCKVGKVHLFT